MHLRACVCMHACVCVKDSHYTVRDTIQVVKLMDTSSVETDTLTYS